MTLFGIRFEARYARFPNAKHVSVARQLYATEAEAEAAMDTYKTTIIARLSAAHGGFYAVDADSAEVTVIDFIYQP